MIKVEKTKFNVFIVGESLVGKTSIIKTFFNNTFNPDELPTIGLENYKKQMDFDNINNIKYQFKFFDISGRDKFKYITIPILKLADGFIFVFSMDNYDTLQKIDDWIRIVDESVKKQKLKILMGNKIDIDKRIINNETAVNFAQKRNMNYHEVSAKTGFRINDTICSFCKKLYDYEKNKNENNLNNQNNE